MKAATDWLAVAGFAAMVLSWVFIALSGVATGSQRRSRLTTAMMLAAFGIAAAFSGLILVRLMGAA